MNRIVICGYAAVQRQGRMVINPAILATLAGLGYEDDVSYTLSPPIPGLSNEKAALAAALRPDVVTSFGHRKGEPLLVVTAEYRSRRRFTQAELQALVAYTTVQWGAGIGEELTHCPIHEEYDFMFLWSKELVKEHYPSVEVSNEYPTIEFHKE